MAACCSSCARSSSRALSTRIAFARFLSCERSSWHVTTSPVGTCVIRTAESVVLTPCPPGPDERYTSTRRSFSSTRTSTSSASGNTATVTVEVWMRPLASVTGTRCTRWTPRSNLSRLHAPRPWMKRMTSLRPPTPVGLESITSTFQRCASAYFVYMRASSAANSAASSPPAPARISTKTFLSSFGSLGRTSFFSSSSSAAWRADSSSIWVWASSPSSRSPPSARMWRASPSRLSTSRYSVNFSTISRVSACSLRRRAYSAGWPKMAGSERTRAISCDRSSIWRSLSNNMAQLRTAETALGRLGGHVGAPQVIIERPQAAACTCAGSARRGRPCPGAFAAFERGLRPRNPSLGEAGRSASEARDDRRKGGEAPPPRFLPHGVHGGEELLVGLGELELVQQQLHPLDGVELRQRLAQEPDLLQLVLLEEQLFLARARLLDVDGGEDALVHEAPVEMDFHVAGALELLEDHIVHPAARVHDGGGHDGQRAPLLDVARLREEAARPLQRVGVETAREHLAGGRDDGVVGAREARQRVEQDHHVPLVLDQPLGLLDHHVGHLDVALRRLVEGGRDDLALHRALHVGDLFRPLVDEQHDEVDLRVVLGDGVGQLLQHHRLTGARRGHDHAALPLADGTEQVHHARGQVFGVVLEAQPLQRIERCEVVEEDLLARLLGRLEVDRLDLEEREVSLGVLRRADLAGDRIAGAQVEAPDLRRRDVDIVRSGQVVVVRSPQGSESIRQDFQEAFRVDSPHLLGLRLEDLEDQLLLAQPAHALDVELAGDGVEVGDRLFLELRQVHPVHRVLLRVLLGRVSLTSLFSAGGHRLAPGGALMGAWRESSAVFAG